MSSHDFSRSILTKGTVIDEKYRIRSLLGQGGMGEVYLAEQLALGRQVALKKMRSMLAGDQESIARFHREARAAGSIGHDNICEVTDLGTCSDGAPYMVMPVLKGTSFAGLLQCETVSLYRLVDILSQTLDALSAAHDAGIVHRDLKPDNVFITRVGDRDDFVKLLDFGISKMMDVGGEPMRRLTHTGAVMGTPAYMAPEQARGAHELDHRVDIYAVGVMLYEAVTGVLPFKADSYNAVMYQILTAPLEPPSMLNKTVPTSIEHVIIKAMARDPLDRYASTEEMRQDVNEALSAPENGDTASFETAQRRPSDIFAMFGNEAPTTEGTVTPMATTITGSQFNSSPRRSRWGLVASLAAVVGVVGLSTALWVRAQSTIDQPMPVHASDAVLVSPEVEPVPAVQEIPEVEPVVAETPAVDAGDESLDTDSASSIDANKTELAKEAKENVRAKKRRRRSRPSRRSEPSRSRPAEPAAQDNTISGRFGTAITTSYED